MKTLTAIALAFTATAAFAHGNVSCPDMPKEEKKPDPPKAAPKKK